MIKYYLNICRVVQVKNLKFSLKFSEKNFFDHDQKNSTFNPNFLEKYLTDLRSQTSFELSQISSFRWNFMKSIYYHHVIFNIQPPDWSKILKFFYAKRSSSNFCLIWIFMAHPSPKCIFLNRLSTMIFLSPDGKIAFK